MSIQVDTSLQSEHHARCRYIHTYADWAKNAKTSDFARDLYTAETNDITEIFNTTRTSTTAVNANSYNTDQSAHSPHNLHCKHMPNLTDSADSAATVNPADTIRIGENVGTSCL